MLKRINNLIWEIAVVPSTNPELIVNGVACVGTTWVMQQKIYLSEELNELTARSVIAHELTHAFLYSTQIQVKDEKTYTEEEVCELISKWGDAILSLTDEIYRELYREVKNG